MFCSRGESSKSGTKELALELESRGIRLAQKRRRRRSLVPLVVLGKNMIATESKERYLAAFEQSQSNGEWRGSGVAQRAAQSRHRELCGAGISDDQKMKSGSTPVSSRSPRCPSRRRQGLSARVDADEIFARSFADAACPRLGLHQWRLGAGIFLCADLPARRSRRQLGAELIKQDDAAFVRAAWASCDLSRARLSWRSTRLLWATARWWLFLQGAVWRSRFIWFSFERRRSHLVSHPRTLIVLRRGQRG